VFKQNIKLFVNVQTKIYRLVLVKPNLLVVGGTSVKLALPKLFC